MPVTFYLHKDANFQNISQGESFDAVVKRTIVARLQSAFPDQHDAYAVLLHDDSAQHRTSQLPDLLIISEHGIGIVNLCHESGSIIRSEDLWYADGKLIQGNLHVGARNPHEQVQLCAEQIRHHLMTPPEEGTPWLSGRYLTWQDLIFDTAVCFTNPKANFQHIEHGEQAKNWERFATFELQGLPYWMSRLAFEENLDRWGSVQNYRLQQRNIDSIVHDLFAATELQHLPDLHGPAPELQRPAPESQRPSPESSRPPHPYGYLLLKQHDAVVARFILDHETMTVGREPSCDVMVPRQYRLVSRVHANLICTRDGVIIQDKSRNGIFIEGNRVQQSARLAPGQHILLGGNCLVEGVCQLEFSTNPALS